MFPYESRWNWLRSPGYLHLVEAIEGSIEEYDEPYRTILGRRAGQLKFGVRVRGVILFFLNLGLVATGLAWLGTVVPVASELKDLVQLVAQGLTGFSLLFTGLFFLVTRFLGQLQADVIASMALGTGGPGPQTSTDPDADGPLGAAQAEVEAEGEFGDEEQKA